MVLDFALLATAADLSGGKLSVLGGGFDTFHVSELPAQVPPFVLAARIESMDAAERKEGHVAVVKIINPDGSLSGNLELPFMFPPGSNKTKALIVLVISTEFAREGLHKIRLLCDQNLMKEFDLHIQVIEKRRESEECNEEPDATRKP